MGQGFEFKLEFEALFVASDMRSVLSAFLLLVATGVEIEDFLAVLENIGGRLLVAEDVCVDSSRLCVEV